MTKYCKYGTKNIKRRRWSSRQTKNALLKVNMAWYISNHINMLVSKTIPVSINEDHCTFMLQKHFKDDLDQNANIIQCIYPIDKSHSKSIQEFSISSKWLQIRSKWQTSIFIRWQNKWVIIYTNLSYLTSVIIVTALPSFLTQFRNLYMYDWKNHNQSYVNFKLKQRKVTWKAYLKSFLKITITIEVNMKIKSI